MSDRSVKVQMNCYRREIERYYPELLVRHNRYGRKAEKPEFKPIDNGARCHKCGAIVYNTPSYSRGVLWQCTACQQASRRVSGNINDSHYGPSFNTASQKEKYSNVVRESGT